MPSISIVTATFNSAGVVRSCMESILTQSSHPVEHIIVDGGSTDGTLQIMKEYGKSISKIVSEPDRGIYDAMNKGVRLASGEIVGILNSDDFYSDSQILEKVEGVFGDPSVDACYGDLLYVREVSCSHSTREQTDSPSSCITHHASQFQTVRYWKSGFYNPRKFYWGWMPPHPTFFVRRKIYDKYGFFDLELGTAADYELMLRFLLKNGIKAVYIPEVLVKMRVGGESNASLTRRLRANAMDRKAWEVNGLKPYPWTLWLKPIRKIPQWIQRP